VKDKYAVVDLGPDESQDYLISPETPQCVGDDLSYHSPLQILAPNCEGAERTLSTVES
jgi:hypothetical protein